MIKYAFDPTLIREFREECISSKRGIAESAINLTWAWPRMYGGKTIQGLLAENFELVWQTGQTAWQRPTDAYLKRKAKQGWNPLTLVKTQRLYDSLTDVRSAMRGSPDTISYGDAQNYHYGVNAESFRDEGSGWSYPEIHNHIGDARGVTRPFMYLTYYSEQRINAWLGLALRDRLQEIHSRVRARTRSKAKRQL